MLLNIYLHFVADSLWVCTFAAMFAPFKAVHFHLRNVKALMLTSRIDVLLIMPVMYNANCNQYSKQGNTNTLGLYTDDNNTSKTVNSKHLNHS